MGYCVIIIAKLGRSARKFLQDSRINFVEVKHRNKCGVRLDVGIVVGMSRYLEIVRVVGECEWSMGGQVEGS